MKKKLVKREREKKTDDACFFLFDLKKKDSQESQNKKI